MNESIQPPCFHCGKKLKGVFSDVQHQPSRAVVFRASGHYGSRVFDPMDAQQLEVSICDQCLEDARGTGRVLLSRSSRQLYVGNELVGSEEIDHEVEVWRDEVGVMESVRQIDPKEVGMQKEGVTWRSLR